MNTDTPSQTLERALAHYGHRAQITKAIEELSELQVELARVLNDPAGLTSELSSVRVVDEIADVQIMTTQLAMMFGDWAVAARVNYKLQRLAERLETSNPPGETL